MLKLEISLVNGKTVSANIHGYQQGQIDLWWSKYSKFPYISFDNMYIKTDAIIFVREVD